MKCENCGKNEVTFVYQSNINGKVTEKHLCGECARELGYSQRIAAHNQNMMQHFFGDSFFGGSLLDDFFAPMPGLMSRMNRMNSMLPCSTSAWSPFGCLRRKRCLTRTCSSSGISLWKAQG